MTFLNGPLPLEVRIGGIWASSIGVVSGLKFSTQWPGGCWSASFAIASLDPATAAQMFDARTLVEIMLGTERVWFGRLSSIDPDTMAFTCPGIALDAGNYLCLDSTGAPTTVANTAVDQAIARGLPWTRPASLATTALKATNDLTRLGALLDAVSTGLGQRWKVDQTAALTMAADPAAPTWQLTPRPVAMGVDGDEFATVLYGQYLWGTTTAFDATVNDASNLARYGRVEYPVDLTPLGALGSTASAGKSAATAKLNGLLALGKARPAVADTLNPSPLELLDLSGCPANLALVKAGDMVKVNGVLDPHGMAITASVVIGTCEYDHDAYTLALTPVGRTPRSLEEIFTVSAPADTTTPSLTT